MCAMSWEEIAESRIREVHRLRSVVREQARTIERRDAIIFQVLEFVRQRAAKDFSEWKDADDWLFANFDITEEEVLEIYAGKDVLIHTGSCVRPGGPQ